LPALDLAVHEYGTGYWKTDVRGAAVFAAAKYLQRDGKLPVEAKGACHAHSLLGRLRCA